MPYDIIGHVPDIMRVCDDSKDTQNATSYACKERIENTNIEGREAACFWRSDLRSHVSATYKLYITLPSPPLSSPFPVFDIR